MDKDKGSGRMTENVLSGDQLKPLYEACKPFWATIPDDMVGKVWGGGPRLRPCPFCGNIAKQYTIYKTNDNRAYVECCKCQAQGPHADTEEDAWWLWNGRVNE